ncbi:hypothetical protein Tco_0756416 [Tanacetum coccineum]
MGGVRRRAYAIGALMSMGRVFKTRLRRRGVKLSGEIDIEFKIVNEYSVKVNKIKLDDAIWAAEKALEKAKMEWESAKIVMEELMFKPHYMSFKAWIWASASLGVTIYHLSHNCITMKSLKTTQRDLIICIGAAVVVVTGVGGGGDRGDEGGDEVVAVVVWWRVMVAVVVDVVVAS